MGWKRCSRCLPKTSVNTLQPLCIWWQLSPSILSKFGHTGSCSFFLRPLLLPRTTLHESIKLARQCSHGIFFSSKWDTKAMYISLVVTDGMFNETRWRKTTFFSSQKNGTRAVRIFCNVSLVALSIFREKYVSWRLDISFSSIHLADPNLILYEAVVLGN